MVSGQACSAIQPCINSTEPCFAPGDQGLTCLQEIPFNATWAQNTLEVLQKSLENFGFSALYHNTGPPYDIHIDVQGELNATYARFPFPSDLDFQNHVQSILASLLDAHTRWRKPDCYTGTFLQPFSFDFRIPPPQGVSSTTNPSTIADEPVVFLRAPPTPVAEAYAAIFPNVNLSPVLDQQATLLNDLEVVTAIAEWGDKHETRSNNPSARFNAALRSFLGRDARSYQVSSTTPLKITLADGSEHVLPWLLQYEEGFGDVKACTRKEEQEGQANTLLWHSKEMLAEPAAELDWSRLLGSSSSQRTTVLPAQRNSSISCFTQATASDANAAAAAVNTVLVMKVASFSPPGDYLAAWEDFLADAQTCLSVEHDMLVVDVMQNGGGYVCLGLRLLEMLIEPFGSDHKRVQMVYDLPHSDLMTAYIQSVNAPDPYPDPQKVEQILNPATQQPFIDGKAYYYPGRLLTQGGVKTQRTNAFSLNCAEAEAMPVPDFKPYKWLPPERLLILTDGTCGSTCASFTKIPQEQGLATFVAAGGLWKQPMDVSSFAGGFVCNPDYLGVIANLSGSPPFPQFLTNQRWQFGWATWYSQLLPSRPVQFTEQEPNFRVPFWGFPSRLVNKTVTTDAVSGLYDSVIASALVRLAKEAPCMDHTKEITYVAGITATTIVALVASAGWFFTW
eukprot:CAMPEP_0175146878 /NCGR_PEP_ID=MMETSP0087-20121206/15642_1 /TAXON_ID=136419 /ORGANISM="Unknown Unknown, Strain D1" /LENGTH=675 /DNA_ID=CAMNT_0016431927 /DNA_START=37 /DNA_END=2061 /DNA_ORIENTATION=-